MPAARDSVIPAKDTRGYYVIVGRGFCGVLNHVTLRQGKLKRKRLGDLPVLHIGFEDPWAHYRPHRMGQAPHLLALPGFAPRSPAGAADKYELSTRFADMVKSELGRLVANGETEKPMDGWVALIQRCDAPQPELAAEVGKSLGLKAAEIAQLQTFHPNLPPYRLLVMEPDGCPRLVYARKIDLCTGGGPPRLTSANGVDGSLFAAYQGKSWEPPASRTAFRYLISGIEALYATSPLPQGVRLCIHGAGGVGVNLVETAMEAGRWVDWMARWTHRPFFQDVKSGRNDILLKLGSYGRVNNILLPSRVQLRFGQGVGLAEVAAKRITFNQEMAPPPPGEEAGPEPPIVVDYHGNISILKDGEFPYRTEAVSAGAPSGEDYGQLIITSGQDGSKERLGSAASLAREFDLAPIVSKDKRVTGMQTSNGDLRILGHAATTMLRLNSKYKEQLKESERYHRTLPLQAHVNLAGITYNAVTIALANEFFSLNRNVNTASSRELEVVLGSESLADQIVRLRSSEVVPWGFRTLEELAASLAEHAAALPSDWVERIDNLRCDYLA
ncbi:MAG TPA: hypothetical protein VEW48_01995 [Thermoanaerobaculia bacterium]|nr:hypothetical protein [Thermoanaerobaculia bacterium]